MKNYIIREKDLENYPIVKKWLEAQQADWKLSIKKVIIQQFRENGYMDIIMGEGRTHGNDSEKT